MGKKRIGFVNYDDDNENQPIATRSEVDEALDAFFEDNDESGRWTSEEIVYTLRETVKLTVSQVFNYMSSRGYKLQREDDRLVWVIYRR